MIRYEGENPLEPQNTTISAILTLEQLNVGKRRFDSEIASIEQKQGRHLTLEEHQRAVENARDISMRQLRVVVQENPFARHPVPQEMFCGPYDERYGLVEAQIERIFAGAEIVKHEERVIS